MVCHGNGYDNFIKIFLKPNFQSKISQNIHNIENFNKQALISLSGKRKAVNRPMRSVRYKPLVRPSCNQCDESFVNKSHLGAHTKSIHKKISRNGSAVFTTTPSMDDVSLMDLSIHNSENEVQLEEICSIESHVCGKCTGVFGTVEELKVHEETEHKEPIIYNCDKCDMKFFTTNRLADHIDQQHRTIAENVVLSSVVIEPLKSCDRCDFVTEDVCDLDDHYSKDTHTVHDQNKSISGLPRASDVQVVPPSVPLSPPSLLECLKCENKFDNNA